MTFSAALPVSPSASSEPECEPLGSARSKKSAAGSCATSGLASQSLRTSALLQQIDWVNPLTLSQARFPVSPLAAPLEDETTPSISGPSSCGSSEKSDPLGSLLRTSLESDMTALTGCVVTLSTKVTPSGRSISILRYRRDSVDEYVSSGWPTPTETANHDSPSMVKWPAYELYQRIVKRTTVNLWEWMMDFPTGWLDSMRSAMPSRPRSRNSSGEPS